MAELNDLLEDALDDLLESNNQPKPEKKVDPSNNSNVEEEIRQHFERLEPQLQEAIGDKAVPEIFGMMQNLISKEMLYPALRDLLPRFEEWLKKDDLKENDRARFSKQKDLIQEMVQVFEDKSLGDQEMFERNLDLMEKMQALGSPPQDLTVPDGQNCSVM